MINLKTFDWNLNNVDTVLFDKDGTIQDLHVYWGEIVKMRSRSLVDDFKLKPVFFKKICLWMGYDLSQKKLLEKGPVGVLSREEIIDQLAVNFKKNSIEISRKETSVLFNKIHEKFLLKMDNFVKILPGIKNLLIILKKRSVKIAIVTSDSVKNAKRCMELLKLDMYIDQYIGREHSILPKTLGKHAKIALDLLGSKRENTVCFGDAPMDLIMARNSGLKAGIGIALGQTPFNKLLKYSKYILNSYRELIVSQAYK